MRAARGVVVLIALALIAGMWVGVYLAKTRDPACQEVQHERI